jgi:hypothetical protein
MALRYDFFSCHPNVLRDSTNCVQCIYIYIYIYIYPTRCNVTQSHSLLYLETALHVSGGTTIHHQERKQLYLQHLVFVTPLLLSVTIVEELEPV